MTERVCMMVDVSNKKKREGGEKREGREREGGETERGLREGYRGKGMVKDRNSDD